MKIQKQIDKYTVQTLGGNCPPREDNDSYVPNTAQAPYKTATNTNNLLYRLLYIVQPGVFTHDCSVLLTVPPPLRQIYTRRSCWGGERKRKSLPQNQSTIW